MGRGSVWEMPDVSFQYVMSSSLTTLLTGRQVLDARIMGQCLLIGLLFSHLSSSTFKGTEPLGLKMKFQELCQVGPAANPSYKTCSSQLSPCCVTSMVPTPMKPFGHVGGNSSHQLQGGIQLWMETQTCRSLHVHVSMCTRCLSSSYTLWRAN